MAKSFTSPSGAPPKMKTGHVLPKLKKHSHAGGHHSPIEESMIDPIREASDRIPSFASRHSHTNNKHGFHTTPARPPAGRLAERPRKPSRGSGKQNRAQL
jgi:hypothetical protein